jgi:CheY-like chemotaxis protein
LSAKPRILCIGEAALLDQDAMNQLRERYEFVLVEGSDRALGWLADQQFDGVYIAGQQDSSGMLLDRLFQNERILEELPDGVALLNEKNQVIWANKNLRAWFESKSLDKADFYQVFEPQNEITEANCPIRAAILSNGPSSITLHCRDNRYFQIQCVPHINPEDVPHHVVATVRNVTNEVLQQQKLTALHEAGRALADLTAQEVCQMKVEERIDLLKSNILYYSKDILNFDVVEIRMLARDSDELIPLLSVGIVEEAARRPLYARREGFGITGYVAATGQSYVCEDTARDPLYLEGCKAAKSSLTVPLVLHDQVIGTFNVESPEPRCFTRQDLQFLEIFSRDIANALNTLELLIAQQANTAQASVEAIHREVALPVDEILNDAVNVMEAYIGHDSSVVDRLRRILQNARDIKQLIHKVGQEMTPAEAVPAALQIGNRPRLRGRRVLVVDHDEDVRVAAHNLLERFGCVIETAHMGAEAVFMVRSLTAGCSYDAIIAEIQLPDMTGYDLLLKLREIMDPLPLILMTGFGYDPKHTIVKARQAGLLPNAILYKPFRLDQLLGIVEGVIEAFQQV